MFDSAITIYEAGLGVTIVHLVCLMIALSCIIISIVDYRIGLEIGVILYAAYFIGLYEWGDLNFYMPLMLMMLALVILILSLGVTPRNSYGGVY